MILEGENVFTAACNIMRTSSVFFIPYVTARKNDVSTDRSSQEPHWKNEPSWVKKLNSFLLRRL